MNTSIHNAIEILHNVIEPLAPVRLRHLQRTAIIAWYLASYIGMGPKERRDLFMVALVNDIGAIGRNKAIVEEPEVATLTGVEGLRSFAALFNHHPLDWTPEDGQPCSLPQQVLQLASRFEQFIDVSDGELITHSAELIDQFLRQNNGASPRVVNALQRAGRREVFWYRLKRGTNLPLVLRAISPLKHEALDTDDFLEICLLVSRLVDRHSNFTMTHSTSVARIAARLGELYGYDGNTQNKLRIAGYLHDIGKLYIPLDILEKRGALKSHEYAHMKEHSYKTILMLAPIGFMHDIIVWAGNHHERLDGSGYPFGISGDDIDMPSRIMAVADVFTALIEDRPYRKGMTREGAIGVLTEEAKNCRLDQDIVALLSHNIDSVESLVVRDSGFRFGD